MRCGINGFGQACIVHRNNVHMRIMFRIAQNISVNAPPSELSEEGLTTYINFIRCWAVVEASSQYFNTA